MIDEKELQELNELLEIKSEISIITNKNGKLEIAFCLFLKINGDWKNCAVLLSKENLKDKQAIFDYIMPMLKELIMA